MSLQKVSDSSRQMKHSTKMFQARQHRRSSTRWFMHSQTRRREFHPTEMAICNSKIQNKRDRDPCQRQSRTKTLLEWSKNQDHLHLDQMAGIKYLHFSIEYALVLWMPLSNSSFFSQQGKIALEISMLCLATWTGRTLRS